MIRNLFNVLRVTSRVATMFDEWTHVYLVRCDHCKTTYISYPIPNQCPFCNKIISARIRSLQVNEELSVKSIRDVVESNTFVDDIEVAAELGELHKLEHDFRLKSFKAGFPIGEKDVE
jgi:hypothetical protein